MLDDDSVKSVRHEIKGQVGGFENHNAWLQAVPSFSSPTPLLLIFALASFFAPAKRRKPRFFFALSSTETLATQANRTPDRFLAIFV